MSDRAAPTPIQRRGWRRRSGGGAGLSAPGVLGILLLLATFAFSALYAAPRWIERGVDASVQAALREEQHPGVEVRVDGQDVRLRVKARTPSIEAIEDVARRAPGMTWAGSMTAPTSVIIERSQPSDSVTPADTATTASPGSEEAAPSQIERATALKETIDRCESALQAVLSESKIRFGINSAALRRSSQPVLARVASILEDCPGAVQVEGHSDSSGAAPQNVKLSQRRAETVVRALTRLGVASSRLSAQGFGPSRPLVEEKTAQDRETNRRIEFHLVPTEN